MKAVARHALIGVGNVLYGDEGVGVHLVHRLRRRYRAPVGLDLLDCGALGWDLLRHLEGLDRVWIVDAVAAPDPADVGSIYVFGPSDVPGAIRWGKLSSHEWELLELLWAADVLGELPDTTLIAIAVDPEAVSWDGLSPGLSIALEARMEALEEVVVEQLGRAGLQLTPTGQARVPPPSLAEIVRHT